MHLVKDNEDNSIITIIIYKSHLLFFAI